MSTRGRVGILKNDGKVVSIYNHSDSYPSYLGSMLLENYKDVEKVEKLISLGDTSFIDKNVDIPEGVSHSFDSRVEGITVAYHRDRGEDLNFRIDESEDEFWKSDIEEYGYLFKNGKWYYAKGYTKKRNAVELTKEITEQED